MLTRFTNKLIALLMPAVVGAFGIPGAGAQSESPVWRLDIPDRPAGAAGGAELSGVLQDLPLQQREQRLFQEFIRGNVPEFLRDFRSILIHRTDKNGVARVVNIKVAPDYMCLGSDEDYLLVPMTPILGQKLADRLGCTLPTRVIVDEIYRASTCKLEPQPIPPGPQMTTVPVFVQHNRIIHQQMEAMGPDRESCSIIAGHKKDVVLAGMIHDRKDRVVIYGWHLPGGRPIQPVYAGHVIWYADYSHGIRLIADSCLLDGSPTSIQSILRDPELFTLLSDETSPIEITAYRTESSLYPDSGSNP